MSGRRTPPEDANVQAARQTSWTFAASVHQADIDYVTWSSRGGSPHAYPLVIWSPNLGVFAASAAGVLCAFPAWWTRYLDSVSAARLVQVPLSLLFLELSGYCVNAVQRHVNAADIPVRGGIDRDGSR